MAAIPYTLLFLSVFCISCMCSAAGTEADGTATIAGGAGTEADGTEPHEAGTNTDEAGTNADEAGTNADEAGTNADEAGPTGDDKLDILMRDVKEIVNRVEEANNTLCELPLLGPAVEKIINRLQEIAVCKNDKVDCQSLYKAGHTTSGVYKIKPDGVNEVDAYCDMTLDGGGWTVIQQRMNGSVDFYLGWADYKKGFGNAAGEYWLGNDHIHALTADHKQKMKVEVQYGGVTRYADYNSFWIDDEVHNYMLIVGRYTGTAGDSLAYHNGSPFTTYDKDNDGWSKGNCAKNRVGAWWYYFCSKSNLNGHYNDNHPEGVCWSSWKGWYTSLPAARMMVKPQ